VGVLAFPDFNPVGPPMVIDGEYMGSQGGNLHFLHGVAFEQTGKVNGLNHFMVTKYKIE